MSEYIYASNGEPLANERGEILLARAGEVVRCKDCKFYEYWVFRDGRTAHDCARGGDYLFDTEPDGFCAWGKK